MTESGFNTSKPLSISMVLHRSCLKNVRTTVESLIIALQNANLSAVITMVDQSLDKQYASDINALCKAFSADPRLTVELVVTPDNRGYGAGHNRALLGSDSDLHLILNPDVKLDPEALVRANALFQHQPGLVLLAPRSVDSSGREDFIAKGYPSVLVLALRAFAPNWLQGLFRNRLAAYELQHLPTSGRPQPVTLVSGCCMWVRGDALRAVRGFNEDYFLYFEDYDLSLRLAEHGKVMRAPNVLITHFGGNAARKGFRHIGWFAAGGWRFFSQWGWKFF